tara:strand:+ start:206 stop:475 length:270 start_codon:yes stop_codon:yes gene_type:complete
MKVKVIKNPATYTRNKEGKRVPYGWVVFPVVKYGRYWELDECPLHMWSNPFKTKKNAIKAIKNGRFEKDGVTGISYAKKVYEHGSCEYE